MSISVEDCQVVRSILRFVSDHASLISLSTIGAAPTRWYAAGQTDWCSILLNWVCVMNRLMMTYQMCICPLRRLNNPRIRVVECHQDEDTHRTSCDRALVWADQSISTQGLVVQWVGMLLSLHLFARGDRGSYCDNIGTCCAHLAQH